MTLWTSHGRVLLQENPTRNLSGLCHRHDQKTGAGNEPAHNFLFGTRHWNHHLVSGATSGSAEEDTDRTGAPWIALSSSSPLSLKTLLGGAAWRLAVMN